MKFPVRRLQTTLTTISVKAFTESPFNWQMLKLK